MALEENSIFMCCGLTSLSGFYLAGGTEEKILIDRLKNMRGRTGACLCSVNNTQAKIWEPVFLKAGFQKLTYPIPNPAHSCNSQNTVYIIYFRDESGNLIDYDWAPKVTVQRKGLFS